VLLDGGYFIENMFGFDLIKTIHSNFKNINTAFRSTGKSAIIPGDGKNHSRNLP